jgi:hypothetical protein
MRLFWGPEDGMAAKSRIAAVGRWLLKNEEEREMMTSTLLWRQRRRYEIRRRARKAFRALLMAGIVAAGILVCFWMDRKRSE